MFSLFFSYCHADEALRDQLEKQLSAMKRQGILSTWHDRRIVAGDEIDNVIDANLEAAHIILLLVSPDFLASNYCYDRELARAIQRHEAGKAKVIPVILRACDWQETLLGKLLATPIDGRPVTQWPDRDQAFLEVTKAIRKATEELSHRRLLHQHAEPAGLSGLSDIVPPAAALAPATATAPRTSNLRLKKEFSDRDKDAFKLESFEYLAKFFENSLVELQARNAGIEGSFRRIDANRFAAVLYRSGNAVARCTVFMGGRHFGDGIAYSFAETSESNSYNECLTVHADDQMLYLRGTGMTHRAGHSHDTKLSQEGAAEFYWSMLIDPLQR